MQSPMQEKAEKQIPSSDEHIDLGDILADFRGGEINEFAVIIEGEEKTTWFVWILVACASISGYDTGVISGALVTIGEDLTHGKELTDGQKEFITSATTLGALLGGLVAGVISDWSGRKLSVCHDVWTMIGGRFLIGVGVGLASCIAPLYIQELSPTRLRGRLVVLNVIAYGIDAGWRWMVGLSCIPAGIQFILLYFLPESPRILLRRGNIDSVRRIMSRIYAAATPRELEMKVKVLEAAVQQSIEISNTTTFLQRVKLLLFKGPSSNSAGFNTLMYYSATYFRNRFQSADCSQPHRFWVPTSIFTLVALKWIDQIGRRKIMLWSAPGKIFGLTLASIAFHFLLSMIISLHRMLPGIGNSEVRGLGTSISTAMNWAANLLINSTYLSLMAKITPAGAFGFYAGLCLLGWVFVIFCYPETAGLSLEEVMMIFRSGFGIQESQRLRAEKQQIKARAKGMGDIEQREKKEPI
ncbi:major facilitator superfamily domain-containing protein [Lentinula detonsa]|uniref:Major facilitator superfamily domain-containing protein n=1 Tax=Lentinula detonsa TaxID=2804962 RepID=A0A9W8NVR3_9AGAR|nr:major facilitator superfamily domain-containing protein [Lentinula detonsa]